MIQDKTDLQKTAYVWQRMESDGLKRFFETGTVVSESHKLCMSGEIILGLDSLTVMQNKLEECLEEKEKLQKLLEFVQNSFDTTE
jgi:hypothetical protein